MFSVRQKRDIADKVQKILRETGHPELPECEIPFRLQIKGANCMSWAEIKNNGAVVNPGMKHRTQIMPDPKLKPCPFCGSEAVVQKSNSFCPYRPGCMEPICCGFFGDRIPYKNKQDAIDAWNRRADEAPTPTKEHITTEEQREAEWDSYSTRESHD